MTCGAAAGGSQAEGKDKKRFPAHLRSQVSAPCFISQLCSSPRTTITSLEPQSSCHCLGLTPGKWDLFPKWSLFLDFLFSGPTYPHWRLSRTFLTLAFLPSLGQTPDCSQLLQGFCPQQLQTTHLPPHSNGVKTILERVLSNNFTKYCKTKMNCF